LIVVDSSALLAIFFDEPEAGAFAAAIVSADGAKLGAPNLLEASMIVENRMGEMGCRELDALIAGLGVEVVGLESNHITAGRIAFRRYGKGRHPAALNFGDCCAYALAKTLDAPLLFKGNDFVRTDIKRLI
jgi:ribonuclease VapC